MTSVASTTAIHASIDAVWQVISAFDRAGQYLAMVVACTVAGAGIGALRSLTSIDGSTIVERLDSVDNDARRLSYSLLTTTSFRNCLTTMALRGLGPHDTEVRWTATFDADGLPASEAAELMEGALVANGLALKQSMER